MSNASITNVGKKYKVITDTSSHSFPVGSIIELFYDDGSKSPLFEFEGARRYCRYTDLVPATPCEKLGYKTGDKFTHTYIRKGEEYFTQGQVITLTDDGSENPRFEGVDDGTQDYWYLTLEDVTPYVEQLLSVGVDVNDESEYLSKPDYLSKLRDKIAIQQLAVLTPIYWDTQEAYSSGKDLVQCQVESAYEYADAMLKQRLVK